MTDPGITKDRLETLLRDAERAHADYERQTGTRDENWPAWYADNITDRLRGEDTPSRP